MMGSTRGLSGVGVLGLSALISASGCSGFRVGGYEHVDMSNSHYAGDIRRKAVEYTNNPRNSRDYMTAGEFFGLIGELDPMDDAFRKYFEIDPASGITGFQIGDKIHAFYGDAPKEPEEDLEGTKEIKVTKMNE